MIGMRLAETIAQMRTVQFTAQRELLMRSRREPDVDRDHLASSITPQPVR